MRIRLAPEVGERLRVELREAGKREIGGMIFAEQLALSDFCIVDFSLDAASGSHTAFQREPALHQKTLAAFFDRTRRRFDRFNYLGEWHSHPSFAVAPSLDDLRSMNAIVANPGTAISFAVLLIVRLRWRLWLDYSLTLFARDRAPEELRGTPRVRWI